VQKISNSILLNAIEVSCANPSYSLKDCSLKLGFKELTLYNWHRNLKSKKWSEGYNKTSDGEPLDLGLINKFIHTFEKINNSSKVSNQKLSSLCKCYKSDISRSLKDCCIKLNYKFDSVYSWQTKLRNETWTAGYSKTEDSIPLSQDIIDEFLESFVFSRNAVQILKKLVVHNKSKNKHFYANQMLILKRTYLKYPNINFWLTVDFGPPKEDILLFLGKAEQNLQKKFIDFTAKDKYTKFSYNYKPEKRDPRKKKKKNIWDYY